MVDLVWFVGHQVVIKWSPSGYLAVIMWPRDVLNCWVSALDLAVMAKVPNFIILLRAGVLWKSGWWVDQQHVTLALGAPCGPAELKK